MELFKTILVAAFVLISYSGEGLCYESKQLCRFGEEICPGSGCYDPKSMQCFRNATIGYTILCRINESVCSSSRYNAICYDPKFEICYGPRQSNNTMTESSVVCNKGQKLCNTHYSMTCYTPEVHVCLDLETTTGSGYSALCMKGQKLCDNTCYFPETRQCLSYKFD